MELFDFKFIILSSCKWYLNSRKSLLTIENSPFNFKPFREKKFLRKSSLLMKLRFNNLNKSLPINIKILIKL